jgi:hypothetical protein
VRAVEPAAVPIPWVMGRKNLLEAFQQLEAQRRGAAPQPHSEASESGGGVRPAARRTADGEAGNGPAPAAEPAVRFEPAAVPARTAAPRAAATTSAEGPWALAPLAVLLFVLGSFGLGFLAGRQSNSAVRASGEEQAAAAAPTEDEGARRPLAGAPGSERPSPSNGGGANAGATDGRASNPAAGNAGAADTPGAAVERALRDPSNRYTVCAITYNDNEYQRQLAQATTALFRQSGLPVSDPLRVGDRDLVVLVGASPRQDDLVALRDRVRTQGNSQGRVGDFATAEIKAIDTILAR